MKLIHLTVMFLLALIGLGCATGPLQDSDMEVLKVSPTQKTQLNRLMLDVERQMMKVPHSELSPQTVEEAMTERGTDIAAILDSDQVSAYRTDHRALFARQIYRSVRARHRRGVQDVIRSRESPAGAMQGDPPEP